VSRLDPSVKAAHSSRLCDLFALGQLLADISKCFLPMVETW
jgi:hypothetical protein